MKKRKFIRFLAAVLALLLLLCALLSFGTEATDAAEDTTAAEEELSVPSVIEEGTYRIRSALNDLYLHAFVYYKNNKVTWRMVVAPFDAKDNGQCFVLKRDKNDCWTLTPKNDSQQYRVTCENGTGSGAQVTKTKTEGKETLFDITPVGDFFTIAPSYGDNLTAVVSVGSEAYKQDYYCEISDYERENARQLWILEPISTTGLTVAWKQTKVKLYSTGVFGAAMMPEGNAVSGALWTSSDESVLLIGNDGSYCSLACGTATVSVTKDGYSASFDVTVTDADCFTWYSQNSVSGSDWDGSLLTNQYWNSNAGRLRYIWDGASPYNYRNCMDTGCAICAIADVLHNMGAVIASGYTDFRSGQNTDLPADPYTVSLSNTYQKNILSGTGTYSGDPTYVAWARIADAFTVDGEKVAFRRLYFPTRQKLKELLETHPQGVIAQFSRGENTHYVVIAECANPEEKVSSKLDFYVYDPAAYMPQEGEHVLFTDSISYRSMSYRYGNLSAVIIYDTESNINN